MTKAVILAAGRGTRMGALTVDVPKPMLPLAGRPILEHILERLRAAEFTRALVVTGYRGEVIEAHFAAPALELQFARQQRLDGTARAALLAREFVGADDFLLTYGDILADAGDYRAIAGVLAADPRADAAVGVKETDDPWQGAAVYERSGLLTAIIEKPPPGTSTTRWNSAGLYAFRPSVFAELQAVPKSPRGEYELTSAIARMIAAGGRLHLYVLRGAWRDIGRPEDLQAASGTLSTE